jgi:hypothetical protein
LAVEPSQAVAPRAEASANQQIAATIAEHLRQNAQLHHYDINVIFQDGVAELRGSVLDQPQREEVLRSVQGVPGVERVRDQLNLSAGNTIAKVQATQQAPGALAAPGGMGAGAGQLPESIGAPGLAGAAPYMGGGMAPEPTPVFQAPMPGPQAMNQPAMPPNAWPTYAPYNNFSRVAYPEAYPYQSWPFIGPVYPFPKVPLGWRSVKLEWQDGHWWYSRVATKHDWWRLRYW